MVDTANRTKAPAEWSEAIAKSEAQLAAGETVPATLIRQRLRESIARLEAKQADEAQRKAVPRR